MRLGGQWPIPTKPERDTIRVERKQPEEKDDLK
jgi:hypothetical protein